MRHDTSSPAPEARAWLSGRGKGVDEIRDFVASYVVKKAPAGGGD